MNRARSIVIWTLVVILFFAATALLALLTPWFMLNMCEYPALDWRLYWAVYSIVGLALCNHLLSSEKQF